MKCGSRLWINWINKRKKMESRDPMLLLRDYCIKNEIDKVRLDESTGNIGFPDGSSYNGKLETSK